ncbi:MAG: hypothetical protein JRF33_05500 [Deltaproteobacteria bacterium]|nr:hypothetical protein [Deltaproteobacteria bacterium]
MMSAFLKTCATLALLVTLLGLTAWTRFEIKAMPADPTALAKEVLLLPPGAVIRRIDLGHHSLAADLLFIRANLYYGHHMHTDEQMPWLADFIDSLLVVDPDFKKSYLWGAMVTLYFQRQVDSIPRSLIERANRILEKGMERFPLDPDFPAGIGYNFHYELGDPAASLPYFIQAASLPNAPAWLDEKILDLFSKQGRKDAAKDVLTTMVLSTSDPNLNRALTERMAFLMDEEEREQIEGIRRRWQAEWMNDYPFLDYDLFFLVREP